MAGNIKTVETFVEKPATLARLREDISSGAVKAVDLAGSYYDRIAALNSHLNIYLSLTRERALEQAARVDAMAAKGDPLPPLAGIPVGIKDVLVMRGAPSTAGSRDPERVPAALRCHRGFPVGSRRSRASGQAQLRRVRHGLVERKFGLRSGAQPGRSGDGFRADPAADRPPRWPPIWPWRRWVRIPAAPSASRPASAAWSAFCPRMGACRATDSSLLRRRWTGSGLLPQMCAMPLRC